MASTLAACGGDGDSSAAAGGSPAPGFGLGTPTQSAAICGDANLAALRNRVFVAPQGTDGSGCGASASTACKTIQQGIANCGATGCGVLVRWGSYSTSEAGAALPDRIVLREGVNVYGGCLFDGEPDRKRRTIVRGPPDGQPAVTAAGIRTATTLQGVMVLASSGQTPGAPSVAMTVEASTGLVLRHTRLVSARGADGGAGQPPGPAAQGGAGGAGGQGGSDGGAACQTPGGGPETGIGGAGGIHDTGISDCGLFSCNCVVLQDRAPLFGASSGGMTGGAAPPFSRVRDGIYCYTHTTAPTTGDHGDSGNTGECTAQGGGAAGGVWQHLGNEGETVTVPAGATVRFGADGRYVQRVASGSFVIGVDFFGSDPNFGTRKQADVLVRTWQRLGNEGERVAVPPESTVRFGADGKFVTIKASGTFLIGVPFFGSDPIGGTRKHADLLLDGPAAAAGTDAGIFVGTQWQAGAGASGTPGRGGAGGAGGNPGGGAVRYSSSTYYPQRGGRGGGGGGGGCGGLAGAGGQQGGASIGLVLHSSTVDRDPKTNVVISAAGGTGGPGGAGGAGGAGGPGGAGENGSTDSVGGAGGAGGAGGRGGPGSGGAAGNGGPSIGIALVDGWGIASAQGVYPGLPGAGGTAGGSGGGGGFANCKSPDGTAGTAAGAYAVRQY